MIFLLHRGVNRAANVWEWCADWYNRYPGSTEKSDTFGQKFRVLRGGSWLHYPFYFRVAYRCWFEPAIRYYGLGFRSVRTP